MGLLWMKMIFFCQNVYVSIHTQIELVSFFSVCVCVSAHLPGRRQVLWECVEKDSKATVAADLCDPALQPTKREEDCNTQSCPA